MSEEVQIPICYSNSINGKSHHKHQLLYSSGNRKLFTVLIWWLWKIQDFFIVRLNIEQTYRLIRVTKEAHGSTSWVRNYVNRKLRATRHPQSRYVHYILINSLVSYDTSLFIWFSESSESFEWRWTIWVGKYLKIVFLLLLQIRRTNF